MSKRFKKYLVLNGILHNEINCFTFQFESKNRIATVRLFGYDANRKQAPMKNANETPQVLPDHQTMWQAVLDRDSRYRGVFVYAVRSTGIYCLPTCPSRRPHLDQVTFFATADAAEAAGFRPCRRCHPQQSVSFNDRTVEKARLLLEQNVEKPLSLSELGRALNLSPSYLHRVFKSKTGLTPRQYSAAQRLKQFKDRVKAGEPVASAMYGAGFSSSSRLYENAAQHLGMTPATYRKGGLGMVIYFTTLDTSLGKILVAGTHQGVCRVSFGDNETQMVATLQAEYPAAHISRDDNPLKPWVDIIAEYMNGKRLDLSLPLDIQATAFQQRVWEALRKIPYGSTRTYSEVAASIGNPHAARAVASACASNPVALVTPCHRVVRSDGQTGGYRWGEERKQALLSRERLNKLEITKK
jgi:AraC family transcriptional regulator, regulatory protein of adaptative response / methylated-DNA-[protein]-cysteine methyltransferase